MPWRTGVGELVEATAGSPTAWCTGSGSYVSLPPPAGARDMAPLPWQGEERPRPAPLDEADLDASERKVLAACDEALARADRTRPFLRHFWGILPQPVAGGAQCPIAPGPHLANRVGHVQGGILLGFAAETATLAVPGHPHLATIAAWYIGPGQGGELACRSTVLHAGRSQAVVRTEIVGSDGSRVLEATSAHLAESERARGGLPCEVGVRREGPARLRDRSCPPFAAGRRGGATEGNRTMRSWPATVTSPAPAACASPRRCPMRIAAGAGTTGCRAASTRRRPNS